MRLVGLIGIIIVVAAQVAFAADLEMSYGQLSSGEGIAIQVIGIKNNGAPIKSVEIECGFFQGTHLLAATNKYADNIASGQTAYVEVRAYNANGANRAECRIVEVR